MKASMKNHYLRLSAARCRARALALLVAIATGALAQTPSATPTPDQRGLGIQGAGAATNSQTDQQAREARPELVLQTGYSNLVGATRLVFSPDGRLLATATFRGSIIKLWETATGRELRNLSSGTQSALGMSPFVAFSADSRLVAAAVGDNSVKDLGRNERARTANTRGLAGLDGCFVGSQLHRVCRKRSDRYGRRRDQSLGHGEWPRAPQSRQRRPERSGSNTVATAAWR